MAGTLYEWLGINPAASAEVIIEALRCKVMELNELRKRLRLHPDPQAEKLIRLGFLKIAQARDNLLNPQLRLAYDRSIFPAPPSTEAIRSTKLEPGLRKAEEAHPVKTLSGSEVSLPLELLDRPGIIVPKPAPPRQETEEKPDWFKSHASPEAASPVVQAEPAATPPHPAGKELPYWLVGQGIPPSQTKEPVASSTPQPEQGGLPFWLGGVEPSPTEGAAQEKKPTSPDLSGSQSGSEVLPDWMVISPEWDNTQTPETRQTKPLLAELPVSMEEPDDFPSQQLEMQDIPTVISEPVIPANEDIAAAVVEITPADNQPGVNNRESSELDGWLETLPPMEIAESPDWLEDLEAYLDSAEPITIEQIAYPEPPLYAVTPQPGPSEPLIEASLPAPIPPPTDSVERLPASPPQSESVVKEITRYGRVDYYTPVDRGWEYPLRVNLLLDRHKKSLRTDARILWATLGMAASEEEPTILIKPSSKFMHITPSEQAVKVKKGEEVFANFRVLPIRVPRSLDNKCILKIDFLYRDKVIQTVSLDVKVQWKIRLGPLHVSHMQWKWFGLIGFFDSLAGLFGFLTPTGSLANILILSGSLLFGLSLLIMSLLLWLKAAKHLHVIF